MKSVKFLLKAFVFMFSFVFFVSSVSARIEESQGLRLDVPGDVVQFVKIETSNDKSNIFKVAELGSVLSAKRMGQDVYGAGWIFTISKISEKDLHNLLQNDASGRELFAFKGGEYYIYNHPTDVRFLRKNNEDMKRDQKIWTRVNEWGFKKVRAKFITDNNLIPLTADNSGVGIALARVMYDKSADATLSSLAAGTFKIDGKTAERYLKNLLYDANFKMTDETEPDGEYIGLKLPKEKLMLKFHIGYKGKNYVTGEYEGAKPIVFTGETLNVRSAATEVAKLYQALADKANKPTTSSGDLFVGAWHETIAGRGHIDIVKSEDAYKINIKWGESAAASGFWQMTARFKNGALVYDDCEYKSVEFDGKGGEKIKRSYKNGKGEFKILATGELLWSDFTAKAENDSVFARD